MTPSIKLIPYGVADYRQMREDNGYYVDKPILFHCWKPHPIISFASARAGLGKRCGFGAGL